MGGDGVELTKEGLQKRTKLAEIIITPDMTSTGFIEDS